MTRKPTPLTTLELRSTEIPRGPIVALLEQQTGRALTHEHRHYLAGQPVHCGDLLELYWNHEWVLGRYEWTASPDDLPIFEAGELVVRLDASHLLRWPEA